VGVSIRRIVPLAVLACLAVLPVAGAAASHTQPKAKAFEVKGARYPGMQHLRLKYGPVLVKPGQNTIEINFDAPFPKVPGYITRFSPNLTYLNGKVPRVDVLHLHHGVWLLDFQPVFAAGEEKTILNLPRGYGFAYRPGQKWALNYMIHNLLPNRDRVYMTYDLDFVPASTPAAKRIHAVHTIWNDVEASKAYPVFDALRGMGKNGRYTYPTQSPTDPYAGGAARNRKVIDRAGALVFTAGHLHPGGLANDLYLTRGGRSVRIFHSVAKYWEPAGAVSWDVAMTATPTSWRVAVKPGDILSTTATYDTRRASWYESMGIMPVAMADGVKGVDPFKHKVDVPGAITHGPLPENRVHGGKPSGLPTASSLPDGPVPSGPVAIKGFVYGQGDLAGTGLFGRPPIVKAGESLSFVNLDANPTDNVFHTITACKAPCTATTGIAYPLADGPVVFDSSELGFGLRGFTPASNRDTWRTPASLSPGTYTYFCRIHPFMRGAFRVVS